MMKFCTKLRHIYPVDSLKRYGMVVPIPFHVVMSESKKTSLYEIKCNAKYHGILIHGVSAKCESDAIHTMLMWLDSSVKDDSNVADWEY